MQELVFSSIVNNFVKRFTVCVGQGQKLLLKVYDLRAL